MPQFHYTGADSQGTRTRGTIDAADRKAALRRLAESGMSVSELGDIAAPAEEPQRPTTPLAKAGAPRFGPHPAARAFFENYRELIAGGLPPGDAVRQMARRVTDPQLKGLCGELWRDLAEGISLADSLGRRSGIFEEAVCRLVEAGEQSGKLEAVVDRILEDYTRRDALKTRVITALGYPVFIVCLAMLVLTLFVFWIMPRMEDMMRALGGEFPWTVKIVMFASGMAVKGAPLIIIIGAIALPGWKRNRQTTEGRLSQDTMLLRFPLAGTAIRHAETARLADLLSTLLGSGLSATDAMRLAEKPIDNAAIRTRFGEVRRRINDGAGFGEALRDANLFEPTDLDLISVGENAGALPRAFAAIADRRRRALDNTLKRSVTAITATFLGGAIGLVFFCLISIVTTILAVSQNVLPHR